MLLNKGQPICAYTVDVRYKDIFLQQQCHSNDPSKKFQVCNLSNALCLHWIELTVTQNIPITSLLSFSIIVIGECA